MSEGTAAKPGSRREGRERMLGYLYEAEAKGVTAADIVEGLPLAVDGYARQLLEGLGDDVSGIDTLIEDTSHAWRCLLYTSPSPRDGLLSRMPSSA